MTPVQRIFLPSSMIDSFTPRLRGGEVAWARSSPRQGGTGGSAIVQAAASLANGQTNDARKQFDLATDIFKERQSQIQLRLGDLKKAEAVVGTGPGASTLVQVIDGINRHWSSKFSGRLSVFPCPRQ